VTDREAIAPFVAQVSSGDSCVDRRYLMAGAEFSTSKLTFAIVVDFAGLERPRDPVPVLLDPDEMSWSTWTPCRCPPR
jgi:hypothetical protein